MKRILFVDDERALLDGLRARLHRLRAEWEMVFVESGARAVTEIEQRRFDVVVSDVRMPVMDGDEMLDIVAERWPETARIVLSGYAEEEKAIRLPVVAHQHLSKPCDPQRIENAIRRCLELHELLREPALRAMVGAMRGVPLVPRVGEQLRALMAREHASVAELAHLASADSALAAKILQVVNTSFFRLPRRTSRLADAIDHVGIGAIRGLMTAQDVFTEWPPGADAPSLQPERLQSDACRLAMTARALADGASIADDAMLAGLLHNIGYRVLLRQCPAGLAEALTAARKMSVPMHVAERAVLGASHAEIGAYLLGLWGLPRAVVDAVAYQYSPDRLGGQFDAGAALAIARSMIEQSSRTSGRLDVVGNNRLLESLHAPFDWDEAQRRASRAFENWPLWSG